MVYDNSIISAKFDTHILATYLADFLGLDSVYIPFEYVSKSFGSSQRRFIQFTSRGYLIGAISETRTVLREKFDSKSRWCLM